MKEKIPSIIFNIGTPCSGKSTFSAIIVQNNPEYTILDDLEPLHEIFIIEELVSKYISLPNNDKILEQFFILRDNLKYAFSIWNFYNSQLLKIKNFSFRSKALNDGSYKILSPTVWDDILMMLLKNVTAGKYVIEFSRGCDIDYMNHFEIKKEDIYKRAFGIMKQFLSKRFTSSLIVNIKSNFLDRMQRNEQRKNCGGHYVPKSTMETTYKNDCFDFQKTTKNKGFYKIENIKIPVFSFVNKQSLPSELQNDMSNYWILAKKYYSLFSV
jgi:hypothetical protein